MSKEKKRKIIQFFNYNGISLVLCDTGEIFSFQEIYDRGSLKINWHRREDLENIVENKSEEKKEEKGEENGKR